ncbi:hypothetical protein G6F63_014985 [Rhizopus arrhizus]|nr:hypothetical protein G6F63_014985 [Rhizopus arrhizus]
MCRFTRFTPNPYISDAAAPAITAVPMLRPDTLAVASTTTPAKPTSSAPARRMPIFSPKNRKAISAANSTVMALQIAPSAAGACSAA